MGKTRKIKPHSKGANPIGIPSLKDLQRLEDEFNEDNHSSGPIEIIQEQLESPNVEEKINALQSLAVLSANVEKVKLICSTEIVRTAAPLLFDQNQSIRNATAGGLRNMSVNGLDVCINLVEQDVLTPLLALLNEYAKDNDWKPTFDEAIGKQLDIKSDTFLQAINLLWNLCESTSVALDSFNQSQLLASFIRCLDYNVFGIEIAISVAQCLLVVSEENSNSWNILTDYLAQLISLLSIDGDYCQIYLRTLSAGILSNVPALAAAHSNQILPALSRTLDVNHRNILGEISSRIPFADDKLSTDINIGMDNVPMEAEETEQAANVRRRKNDLPTQFENEVRFVGYLLDAQRLAAEILTNQCSSDEEEWIESDKEEMSDEESVIDYGTSYNGSSTNLQSMDKLPVEVLEAIKSLGLVEKLYQKAQPLAVNVDQLLRETGSILVKKVKSLRISALLCLQNLCNAMSTDDLGGPGSFYGVWLDLGHQVFQGPQDLMLLEPSTSLMRAALDHLKSNKELFQQMTETDLDLILKGVQNCSVSEIRANWLRMLGTLGCLLSEPLVKKIIVFIFEACAKEQDVWTISEAVDALMDMFSDNDWTQIVYDLNLPTKCNDMEKVFKSKMRQQKRELKDRYPAVLTVRTNFTRFVKYLECEFNKFTPPNGV